MTPWLIGISIGVPFLLAMAWFLLPRGLTPGGGALWLAPLPALGLAIFGGRPGMAGPFVLDLTAVMLVGAAAILWSLAGLYARTAFRTESATRLFGTCWLLSMAGSFGVFLTREPVAFLVFYAMVSLPAYGLVIAANSAEARKAGNLYLAFALIGENVLLIGFVLLQLEGAVSALPFLLAGFGLKIALWPCHFWMPAAHAAAGIPASAVLSGIVVKAGIIGFLRFLPFDQPMPAAGEILAGLGFFTALFAVVVGLRQSALKMILGYSSVSQMGFLAAVVGMGLAGGEASVVPLAAFYAANHVLVKGMLFLSVGCRAAGPRAWIPAMLLGLGLAGLPLTGGALAKLAVKDPFGGGLPMILANASAVGTAILMLHFAWRLRRESLSADVPPPQGLPVVMAGAAIALTVPWIILPVAGVTFSEVIADALKTLGPIAAGLVFFVVFGRLFGRGLPSREKIPPTAGKTGRLLLRRIGQWDELLRQWPVAITALTLLLIVMAWMFFIF